MSDWATLNTERRDSLVALLRECRRRYQIATHSLQVFIKDTREAIESNRASNRQLMQILGFSSSGSDKLTELSELASEEEFTQMIIALERVASGEQKIAKVGGARFEANSKGVQLLLDGKYADILRAALFSVSGMYDTHASMQREMAIIYGCALFDGLVADLLTTLLTGVPAQLKSSRKITYEEALRYASRDELIVELARREMLDVTRGNVLAQLEYFKINYHIDMLNDGDVDGRELLELFEKRHLLVHNNGVVSTEYYEKISRHTPVGARISFDNDELAADLKILAKTGLRLVEKCVTKFERSGKN